MTGSPEVSVIVPARNVARWVQGAIASVGGMPPLEIIVVDDGSSDGTAEVLARLARHDARIRVLAGPGRGPSAARNLAIEAARAPLLAFLDADDAWRPRKLAIQLALHAANPSLGFSFTDYRHVTEAGEDRGTCFRYWQRFGTRHAFRSEPFLLGRDALAQLYAENVVGTSTVVADTRLVRAVGGFPLLLNSGEDWDLWLRLAAHAAVGCVPAVLTDYLMHRPGNISHNLRQRLAGLRHVAARHGAAAANLDPEAFRTCQSRLLVAEAEMAQAEGRRWRATGLRLRALRQQPSVRLVREAAAGLLTSPQLATGATA